MTRRGWALFAALSVIWGIPYLLIKIAVDEVHPAFLVLARTAIAGGALLPIALLGGHFRGLRQRWPWVLAFGVMEVAIPWILLGYAELRLTSSMTALILAAIPMVALLGARAIGLEGPITPTRWLGLVLGSAGVAAVAGLDLGVRDLWAVVAVLVVVVLYALAPLVVAVRLNDVSGLGVASAAMLVTAALYLPIGLSQRPDFGSVSIRAWVAIVVLGLVCSSLAFVLFFALIAAEGPARAAVITFANPVVAAVAGVLILNERITPGLMVGFPLVLAGSYLATRRAPAAPGRSDPEGVSPTVELSETV